MESHRRPSKAVDLTGGVPEGDAGRERRRTGIQFPLRDNPHDARGSCPLAFRDLPADAIPAFFAALGLPPSIAQVP